MQVGVDEALAATDVVHTADGRMSSVRQRVARLLLCDDADSLITQVPVKAVLPCSGQKQHHNQLIQLFTYREFA